MNKALASIDRRYANKVSAYDDFGIDAGNISYSRRQNNAEEVISRFFAWNGLENIEREAIMRHLNPDIEFSRHLGDAFDASEGGFGPDLNEPSEAVRNAVLEYAQTDLGAVALSRLLQWDNAYIDMGWRSADGALTEEGIQAYGHGKWKPFRIASNGANPDTVTPSGALVLPDEFEFEYYSTGDIAHPLAIIHHELKAHVLPLREAAGLSPGREMELICIRLESEMLDELGLRIRQLNWGRDDGTLDHTLHEASESYYYGLVRFFEGQLFEMDPVRGKVIQPARFKF